MATDLLREALDWYAYDDRYYGHDPEVLRDRGSRARAALAAPPAPVRDGGDADLSLSQIARVLCLVAGDYEDGWEHTAEAEELRATLRIMRAELMTNEEDGHGA